MSSPSKQGVTTLSSSSTQVFLVSFVYVHTRKIFVVHGVFTAKMYKNLNPVCMLAKKILTLIANAINYYERCRIQQKFNGRIE